MSPLKSIINDQISEILLELHSNGTVVKLVQDNPPQFLYSSADIALEKEKGFKHLVT